MHSLCGEIEDRNTSKSMEAWRNIAYYNFISECVTSQRHAAYVESILCYSRSICTPCYAHPVIFIIIPVGIVPTEHLLFVKEDFFEQHQKEAFTGASFLMQFNLGIQTKLRSNKAKHRR